DRGRLSELALEIDSVDRGRSLVFRSEVDEPARARQDERINPVIKIIKHAKWFSLAIRFAIHDSPAIRLEAWLFLCAVIQPVGGGELRPTVRRLVPLR